MRVDELARELGVAEEELLTLLASLEAEPPGAGDAVLSAELVERVRHAIGATSHEGLDPELQAIGAGLIRRAYDMARLAGKPDWDTMSGAVLKNRLLDVSERAFDEASFGATSFSEWLKLFPNVLDVDWTKHPPRVRLIDADEVRSPSGTPSPRPEALPPRWRIRRDLWRAVMDIGAAGAWYWDGDAAVFMPGGQRGAEYEVLPTLSPQDMRDLRTAFLNQLSSDSRTEATSRWADELLPDGVLPHAVRGHWVAVLKQGVLLRLREWFKEQQIREPRDLVEEASGRLVGADPLNELRGLIIRCIQVMTRAELEELRLPPSVILRSTKR